VSVDAVLGAHAVTPVLRQPQAVAAGRVIAGRRVKAVPTSKPEA
jgi:hypothetical protein